MNKLEGVFKTALQEKRKLFISFITAGYPDIETTKDLVGVLDSAGCDVVELGVPFSDPLADGPTIQEASIKALENYTTLSKIFDIVKEIRIKSNIPIVLMGYYNPIHKYGVSKFVTDAVTAGVDGVIVPDLPPEEAEELISSAKKKNFSVVFLIAPTSSLERIRMISKISDPFIYYVSFTGITGNKLSAVNEVKEKVAGIKLIAKKPVCVGFGISNARQIKEIYNFADGVIVGSAIIKRIEKNISNKKKMLSEVKKFVESLIMGEVMIKHPPQPPSKGEFI